MVRNTGRTPDTHRVRRLKAPLPLQVEADEHGIPLRLCSPIDASFTSEKSEIAKRNRPWQEVTLLRRPWRIDQHWWRDAVSRMYFRVAPEDGPPLTIYHDLITGDWYRQEY